VIVAEHFTSSPQAHTALIDKQVGRSVTPIGGVHDSGGSCGFECKQVPRRSKKAATFFTTGGPEPSPRRHRRGSQQAAGRFPAGIGGKDALRRLCYGPLGGDQRARNTSSVLPLPAGKDEYFWAGWTPMPDPYAGTQKDSKAEAESQTAKSGRHRHCGLS